MCTVNMCQGNQCLQIGVHSTCEVKQFRRVSFENGNRQTWFDLYVSGSVCNQIHMHILLYYVCHTVQLTEIALNWRCEMQDIER